MSPETKSQEPQLSNPLSPSLPTTEDRIQRPTSPPLSMRLLLLAQFVEKCPMQTRLRCRKYLNDVDKFDSALPEIFEWFRSGPETIFGLREQQTKPDSGFPSSDPVHAEMLRRLETCYNLLFGLIESIIRPPYWESMPRRGKLIEREEEEGGEENREEEKDRSSLDDMERSRLSGMRRLEPKSLLKPGESPWLPREITWLPPNISGSGATQPHNNSNDGWEEDWVSEGEDESGESSRESSIPAATQFLKLGGSSKQEATQFSGGLVVDLDSNGEDKRAESLRQSVQDSSQQKLEASDEIAGLDALSPKDPKYLKYSEPGKSGRGLDPIERYEACNRWLARSHASNGCAAFDTAQNQQGKTDLDGMQWPEARRPISDGSYRPAVLGSTKNMNMSDQEDVIDAKPVTYNDLFGALGGLTKNPKAQLKSAQSQVGNGLMKEPTRVRQRFGSKNEEEEDDSTVVGEEETLTTGQKQHRVVTNNDVTVVSNGEQKGEAMGNLIVAVENNDKLRFKAEVARKLRYRRARRVLRGRERRMRR